MPPKPVLTMSKRDEPPRPRPKARSGQRRGRKSSAGGPEGSSRLPPRLRIVHRQHTLVYGMRLLTDQILEEAEHEHVPLPRLGPGETLTLHQITGDIAEIRRRLHESVDAFFEIYGEELD